MKKYNLSIGEMTLLILLVPALFIVGSVGLVYGMNFTYEVYFSIASSITESDNNNFNDFISVILSFVTWIGSGAILLFCYLEKEFMFAEKKDEVPVWTSTIK